jgi:predicted PurR-regulated permease PerM
MDFFESEKLKHIIAFSGILILATFLLVALFDFVPSFLGALIFYIICSPVVNYLTEKRKFKRGLATAIVLILSFLIILIPLFGVTYALISKVANLLSGNTDFYLQLQEFINYVRQNYNFNILTPENVAYLQSRITNFIPDLLGQTLDILANIAIMYFILFYLLYTKAEIKKNIERYLPYKKENVYYFAQELVSQTYSNVIGSPLLALIQGCAAVLGFWVFGVPEPFFWGMICGVLSFIPFVGSALIWVPAGIFQLYQEHHWQGFAILIYGIVVIINIDNAFRMFFQKKISGVHPLVTVFGLIVGFKWFGLPGFIFGPLLISYLLIMIKIYRKEYENKNDVSPENTSKP